MQIFSDSEYVVKSISKGWLERWRSEDWMAKPNKPRLNSDLWRRVYRLLKEHSVTISWVKAHNGHPENERCDELARFAASQEKLKPDLGYEGQQRNPK